VDPYLIKNEPNLNLPNHPQYYIPNSNKAIPSNIPGPASCNVNYNIKKNIINLNLKQEEEQCSSNYEEEPLTNQINKNNKANSTIDKNTNKISGLKNFNQENFANSSRKNTSNSKKSQQMGSGYFNNNKDYDEDYAGNPNLNLTNKVWPKSRTFLSIVSKMFNENYINEHQRGILKEMIMDHNQVLNKILEEYEMDADSQKLYESIIQLANFYDKNKSAI